MKKNSIILMLSAIAFCSPNNLMSQSSYRPALQKGSVSLNGGVAFSFGNHSTSYASQFYTGENKFGYNTITLSPQLSGFILNGFAIGLLLDINRITLKETDLDSKTSLSTFTAGPILKYYTPGGFFFSGNASFGKSSYSNSNDPDPNEGSNIVKWQLGCGYAIFLNEHIAVEPGLLYRSSKTKNEDNGFSTNETLNEVVLNVSLNIFLHKKGE
jgi:outer membrane protein